MKELESLSKQIFERVENEGTEKLERKEQELNDFVEENRVRLLEQQKTRKQAMETRGKEEYERQVQSLNNQKRNKILAEKQNILTAIFRQAAVKMSEWDAATFQMFVRSVLKHFDSDTVLVTPGEESLAHFTVDFQKRLQEVYPAISISSTAIPNKAGFIIEIGGVGYNFFFGQMVDEMKRDFSPKLANLAFQKTREG